MTFHAYRARNPAGEITAVLRLRQPLPAYLHLAATAEGVRVVDGGTVLEPDQLQEFCVGLRTAGVLSVRLRNGDQLDELPWG